MVYIGINKFIFLTKIWESLKNRLYPIFCFVCKKEGEWFCEKCLVKIDCQGIFCCPICHKNNLNGLRHGHCHPDLLISEVAVLKYSERGVSGEFLKTFKYGKILELTEYLEIFIQSFLKFHPNIFVDIEVITYVPLHRRREVERNFNQAKILADILGKLLGKPVVNFLKRTKYTKQQAKLTKEKRVKNVCGVFEIDFDLPQTYDHILLVDDIFTTGSTMLECAKVLKNRGVAKKISGFTFARE